MGIGRIKDRDRLYLFFGKDKVKAVSLDNLNITKPDEIKNSTFTYKLGRNGKLDVDLANGKLNIDLNNKQYNISKSFDELNYNSDIFKTNTLTFRNQSDYPFYILNRQKEVFRNYESALKAAEGYSRNPERIKEIMINIRENPPVWDDDFLRASFDSYYALKGPWENYSNLFYAQYNQIPKSERGPLLSIYEQRLSAKKIREMAQNRRSKLHIDLLGEVPYNIADATLIDGDWVIFRNRKHVKVTKDGSDFSYRANDYLNRKDAKNVRFYMNVESKAAPEVFEDVLTLVEEVDKDSVISAKISHPVHAGLYSDNIVLYISATDERLRVIKKKVLDIHKKHRSKFKDGTPKGTSQFATGVGMADNPGDSFSYGMIISQILNNAAKRLDLKRSGFPSFSKYKMANASSKSLFGAFLYKYYSELNTFQFNFDTGHTSYLKKVNPNDISKFLDVTSSNP